MSLRRQLPVYSPLDAAAVLAACGTSDARPQLVEVLRSVYGAQDVILTDSGTSALALALRAAAIRRPGAPCALPAYGCYDLATAAIAAGVPVVLYDVEPSTLRPDTESVQRVLAGGAAALVVAHLYGVPAATSSLFRAADDAGALVIDDAAQGVGAECDGRPVGSHGALGVLSFGRGKGRTGGGGGALLVRTAGLVPSHLTDRVERPDRGPAFAISLAAQWLLGRPSLYAIPAGVPGLRLGETVYHAPGSIRGMRRASARVLARTMRLSPDETARRRANAARLTAVAQHVGVQTVHVGGNATPGWLRLPVLLRPGHRPHDAADAGLGIMPGYPLPLLDLPPLGPSLRSATQMPGAVRLARDLWTLPTHSRLSERDLRRLEQWLERAAPSSDAIREPPAWD